MVEFATILLEPEPGARVVADRVDGSGPPWVFLHGLTSVRVGEKSAALFEFAAKRGSEAWRFDLRGHGESSSSLEETTLSELIADARAVLERSGPAILVGSSLGGLIAGWVAARHPDLVRGLVLLAPAFRFLTRLRQGPGGCLLLPRDGEELRFSPRVREDLEHYDEDEMAAVIRQPTLVVHGASDDTVPAAVSEDFVARLGAERKELWVVPGADHRLNQPIREILERAAVFHDG